jgi:ribosome-binding protein aMBF1 (putative translation factor)
MSQSQSQSQSQFEDDAELSNIKVDAAATQPDPAQERSDLAAEILDEIGRVDVDYRRGVTDQSAMFVEDMQQRLEDARARRGWLACSERQLAWLESIREKLDS